MVKTINVDEFKKLREKGGILVVDVRELNEYKAECIDGTCLIPLREISTEKLPSSSGPIVVHCGTGKRSEMACKKLLEENSDLDVYSLEGGISAWKASGGAIKKSENGLSLERQMQLSAGLLIVSGVVLGFLVNQWFYAIAGFVGLGLMFAGITGWCGMIKFLSIMPWNK